MKKLKVLFFAEGATLAHVARPLMLAKGLDAQQFNTVLCRPDAFSKFTKGLSFPVLNLESQDACTFGRKLENGSPLYDFPTLCRYVDADLALIDREKPDAIVGDFRISLSVSARLRSIPYIAICDAYWSPEHPFNPPLPVLKFTKHAPVALTEFLFRRIAPVIFHLHTLPLERLRAKYGLPSLGYDLRRCYTDADLRLFANFPALFPNVLVHTGADFIGPISWSPDPLGDWDNISGDGPLTYITMGSSGNPQIIERIVPILEQSRSRIVIATAGKSLKLSSTSPTTQIFEYLPGAIICQHANLVICNGGSPTTNQALSCGVPVLGIAQNMDQLLNMEAIVAYGAGVMIRADRAKTNSIRNAIDLLMHDPKFAARAMKLSHSHEMTASSSILAQHIVDQCKKNSIRSA